MRNDRIKNMTISGNAISGNTAVLAAAFASAFAAAFASAFAAAFAEAFSNVFTVKVFLFLNCI